MRVKPGSASHDDARNCDRSFTPNFFSQQKGATATFDGIAFNQGEEAHLVVDAIAIIGVQDLDFAGEFVRFVWGCDELEIGSQQLYAWWD